MMSFVWKISLTMLFVLLFAGGTLRSLGIRVIVSKIGVAVIPQVRTVGIRQRELWWEIEYAKGDAIAANRIAEEKRSEVRAKTSEMRDLEAEKRMEDQLFGL